MAKSKQIEPRYYCVNFETYVKVEQSGDDVIGTNQFGNPYPPIKAVSEGEPVSESQYLGAVGAAKQKLSG